MLIGGCLLNKNCFDIIKKLENNSIDLVLTDPPYGISLTPQRKNGKFKDTKNINKLKEYISDEFRPQKYYTQILEIDKIILNNFRFRNEIVKYCNVEWKGSQMKLLGVKEEFDE